MKASVLIVDDDRSMARLVRTILPKEDYQLKHAEDADEAYAFLKKESADLILLDLQLPGISGLKLLELIRQEPLTANIPVIMLTVKSDETHKLKGFETGADDYLVKPFFPGELLARVEAMLRRVRNTEKPSPHSLIETEEIILDLDSHEALIKGRRVDLTPAEFQLLMVLMKRRGVVFTYQNLMRRHSVVASPSSP